MAGGVTGRRACRASTVAAVLAVVVAFVVACSALDESGVPASPGGADASNTELVTRGSEIYGEHCASCHGDNLEGQANWRVKKADGVLPAPPHDETGHTWHHSDAQLFEITKRGTEAVVGGRYKSDMVGFSDKLDDGEIWAVLAYIKSQWPADIQAAQARRSGG